MIAIPAIDLREGACVQLVGGEYDSERVRLPDPLKVAEKWASLGFSRLHLVDLDAATGRGNNLEVLKRLLDSKILPCQVGGGVRAEADIERLLAAGAERVVVGTKAVEDAAWLAQMAQRFPEKLVVAADVRGRNVLTRGWQQATSQDIGELVAKLNALPLAGLLVTAVHKEGQMQGTDMPLMEEVAKASKFPVLASGGVTTLEDFRSLASRGVWGAVVGMALYTGALPADRLAQEFGK
jgi:phosphoribosylformimino-5-aminoimidazole carboxamide ribotide isomerase